MSPETEALIEACRHPLPSRTLSAAAHRMTRQLDATLNQIRESIRRDTVAKTHDGLRGRIIIDEVSFPEFVEIELDEEEPLPGNHVCEFQTDDGVPARCSVRLREVRNGDGRTVLYDVSDRD